MKISFQSFEVFDEKESYKFLNKVSFSCAQYMCICISPIVYMYIICQLKKGYVVEAYKKTALKSLHKCSRCSLYW